RRDDGPHRWALHGLRPLRHHVSGAGAATCASTTVRRRRAMHDVPGVHRGVPHRRHLRDGLMTAVNAVHPIEAESYRILEARVDLRRFAPAASAVVARVIHASADLEYAQTMVVDDDAVAAGIEAVRAGAPVICDVEMVRHGITGIDARCYLSEVDAPAIAAGDTRAAAAMRLAAENHREGTIFVVGCAPTALVEVV